MAKENMVVLVVEVGQLNDRVAKRFCFALGVSKVEHFNRAT